MDHFVKALKDEDFAVPYFRVSAFRDERPTSEVKVPSATQLTRELRLLVPDQKALRRFIPRLVSLHLDACRISVCATPGRRPFSS